MVLTSSFCLSETNQQRRLLLWLYNTKKLHNVWVWCRQFLWRSGAVHVMRYRCALDFFFFFFCWFFWWMKRVGVSTRHQPKAQTIIIFLLLQNKNSIFRTVQEVCCMDTKARVPRLSRTTHMHSSSFFLLSFGWLLPSAILFLGSAGHSVFTDETGGTGEEKGRFAILIQLFSSWCSRPCSTAVAFMSLASIRRITFVSIRV